MKVSEEPYFLSNSKWYSFDEDNCCYKLTDKTPKEAIESYIEFYNKLDSNKTYD